MASKTQTRGNCPCCGKGQAVMADGRMSQHGYTVDNGWFNGVCSGYRYEPMQVQRAVTDNIVASVRDEVIALVQEANGIESGKVVLKVAYKDYNRMHPIEVPFAEATKFEQKYAIESKIRALRSRARIGKEFATFMEATLSAVFGKPLNVVEKAEAAARIQHGDTRVGGSATNPRNLVARYQDGPRVYWVDAEGFKGWTGSRAWRALPMAATTEV